MGGRAAAQRVLYAALTTLGLGALLVIAGMLGLLVADLVGMRSLSAAGTPDTTAGSLGALAIGEWIAAAALVAIAVSALDRPRLGLGTHGAGASIRAVVPLLVLAIGVPALAQLAGIGPELRGASAERVAAIVALALAVGVFEEVGFRGVLVHQLGGAARPLLAVGVSAAFFTLVHMPPLSLPGPVETQVLNAILAGLVVGVPFALVRLRTGSLVGPILAHAAIDVFGFLQLRELRLPAVTPAEAATQVVVALVVLAGYVVWWRRSAPAASSS